MKHVIEEQHRGYIVSTYRPKYGGRLYVRYIYRGEADYTTDYCHAKAYKSKQTALKIAAELSR